MQNLSSHSYRGGRPPPRAEVMRWVDTVISEDGHWVWDTSAPDRRFNRHGHAIWLVETRRFCPRVWLVVARLLLDGFRGPFPRGSSFRSRCGFAGCVNPDHWEHVLRAPSVKFMPFGEYWVIAHPRTGKMYERNVPIIVHAGDAVTHVVNASPDPAKSYRTLCGREVYPISLVVHPSNALVTCKEGCT